MSAMCNSLFSGKLVVLGLVRGRCTQPQYQTDSVGSILSHGIRRILWGVYSVTVSDGFCGECTQSERSFGFTSSYKALIGASAQADGTDVIAS